jgi:hypothetical protein
MFTRRILLPAAIVLSALTIGGTTAGVAVAASSQGHFSADLPAHPAHSLTVQLDRWACGPGTPTPCQK